MLRQVRNHRFNPFTGATAYSVITDEAHAIPASGTYQVRLFEVPDPGYADPTSGTPLYLRTVGGTVFTEVSGSPGLNEFRADHAYKTGWVEFNSGNAGAAILVSYRGTGSTVSAELVNSLQLFTPAAPFFSGDGSDGDLTLTGNTNLDGEAGQSCVFRQYRNLDLAGFTLGLSSVNTPRGLIVNVSGNLSLDATSIITVAGKGMTGGAAGSSSSPAGSAGTPGAYGGGGGGGADSTGGAGGFSSRIGPGAGVGGIGGAPGDHNGTAGTNLVISPAEHYWRSLVNCLVPASGGGGGAGVSGSGSGGAGGAGGGFLLIHANVLSVASGAVLSAAGVNGANGASGGGGGGGAGGTIVIVAHRILGDTAANIESSCCNVSGGTGGSEAVPGSQGGGGAGAAGVKRVVELYSYNVY
ncbi:MAG: hypothetical protein KKA60_01000 [Proteobacteria bacterium]|nr:hypothetical protein [Pseudomonadota bacterium]